MSTNDKVPFKPETWPVDADGFAPELCTECGTPVRYGSRHSRCASPAQPEPQGGADARGGVAWRTLAAEWLRGKAEAARPAAAATGWANPAHALPRTLERLAMELDADQEQAPFGLEPWEATPASAPPAEAPVAPAAAGVVEAWDRLPDALKAHPGIKALHRAALAAASAQPAREAVALTPEQTRAAMIEVFGLPFASDDVLMERIARAVERAVWERNNLAPPSAEEKA